MALFLESKVRIENIYFSEGQKTSIWKENRKAKLKKAFEGCCCCFHRRKAQKKISHFCCQYLWGRKQRKQFHTLTQRWGEGLTSKAREASSKAGEQKVKPTPRTQKTTEGGGRKRATKHFLHLCPLARWLPLCLLACLTDEKEQYVIFICAFEKPLNHVKKFLLLSRNKKL